jgi:membrane associated rhomboid family serine protease
MSKKLKDVLGLLCAIPMLALVYLMIWAGYHLGVFGVVQGVANIAILVGCVGGLLFGFDSEPVAKP